MIPRPMPYNTTKRNIRQYQDQDFNLKTKSLQYQILHNNKTNMILYKNKSSVHEIELWFTVQGTVQ